ncbi:hypothetical protein THAOC_36839, partial [Thalassiosira oceanica]
PRDARQGGQDAEGPRNQEEEGRVRADTRPLRGDLPVAPPDARVASRADLPRPGLAEGVEVVDGRDRVRHAGVVRTDLPVLLDGVEHTPRGAVLLVRAPRDGRPEDVRRRLPPPRPDGTARLLRRLLGRDVGHAVPDLRDEPGRPGGQRRDAEAVVVRSPVRGRGGVPEGQDRRRDGLDHEGAPAAVRRGHRLVQQGLPVAGEEGAAQPHLPDRQAAEVEVLQGREEVHPDPHEPSPRPRVLTDVRPSLPVRRDDDRAVQLHLFLPFPGFLLPDGSGIHGCVDHVHDTVQDLPEGGLRVRIILQPVPPPGLDDGGLPHAARPDQHDYKRADRRQEIQILLGREWQVSQPLRPGQDQEHIDAPEPGQESVPDPDEPARGVLEGLLRRS